MPKIIINNCNGSSPTNSTNIKPNIINDVSNSQKTIPSRPTRGEIVNKMGSSSRDFVNRTPIGDLVSLTPYLGWWYSIDAYYSTTGNQSKQSKDLTATNKFIEIADVPVYMSGSQDIDREQTPERAINIHLTSKTIYLMPMNEIVPKEGDHYVFQIQGELAVPYQITKVTPTLLAEKPGFEIEISHSTIYKSRYELMNNTIKKYIYTGILDAQGSRVIRSLEKDQQIKHLQNIFNYLSKLYTDTFYDESWDMVYFENVGKYEYPNEQNLRFAYYLPSMCKAQELNGVLKYGFNHNRLFLTPPFKPSSLYETNYKRSLIYRLINKTIDIRPKGIFMSFANSCSENTLQEILRVRDRYAQESHFKWKAKYGYTTQLYIKDHINHSILSRFYNDKTTICECYEMPIDETTEFNYTYYEIKDNIIVFFLDMYMDNNYDDVISNLHLLDNFAILKDNFDHFFGIPMLLTTIDSVIRYLIKDDTKGTYY